jgi:hypothetical protein
VEPITPVLSPEFADKEHVFGSNQPQYIPLPALISQCGVVLTRWRLSEEERKLVLDGADIMLSVWTVGQPLQPVMLEVGNRDRSLLEMAYQMDLLEKDDPATGVTISCYHYHGIDRCHQSTEGD